MIQVAEATERQLERWDACILSSINGTLFHRRSFLAYHGDRFRGREKFLLFCKGSEPWAQMSIEVHETGRGMEARSPYGGSYGGVVFQRQPRYRDIVALVDALVGYLREERISRFTIVPPIMICAEHSLDLFLFGLLKSGFRSVSRDITSAVPLGRPCPIHDAVSVNCRNYARKASQLGVTIVERAGFDDFQLPWQATFEKHGVPPTHSPEELRRLHTTCADDISFDVAVRDDQVVASLAQFRINDRVTSSFYLCQDPQSAKTQALTLLLFNALQTAERQGYAWYDIGTSSVNMQARENIFRFKEQFNAIGIFRETLEWTPSNVQS